jgi:hypothetical protein
LRASFEPIADSGPIARYAPSMQALPKSTVQRMRLCAGTKLNAYGSTREIHGADCE